LPIKPAVQRIVRQTAPLGVEIGNWAVKKAARPERLHIYLAHDVLAVCRISGYGKRSVRSKTILTPDAGATDLPALLATLDTWLDAHPVHGDIDWIVGVQHVRYLLLPWDTRLANDAFCRSLTAALFAQHFPGGIPFTDYQLRFAPLAFGQPRLAALIANDIIHALTVFSRQRGSRVRRIAPALSVVWDHFHVRIKKRTGVLGLIEGPRLLRIGYDHGHITTFSIQPFSGTRSMATQSETTWLFPADPAGDAPAFEHLAPGDDPRLAYALCGVA